MENIRTLLKDCSLEAVSHKREGSLLSVSGSATVSEALKTLADAGVLSLPVADAESGGFCGVLSVTDCLRQIAKELKVEKASLPSTCTLDTVSSAFNTMRSMKVQDIMHPGDLWYVEGAKPSVLDAVREMMTEKQIHHRLYTCASLEDTRPNGVLSQSDVTQMLWDHRVELGNVLKKSVEELGLCGAAAETVPASQPTLKTLIDMYRDRKTCMGVVDTAGGKLVGNLSISDLRKVTPDLYAMLLAPVGEFILALHGQPVPEGEVDWSSALASVPLHSVSSSTPYETVLEMLSVKKLHRVYVVDSAGSPRRSSYIGIITLTDVLRPLNPPESVERPTEGLAGGLPAGGGEETVASAQAIAV